MADDTSGVSAEVGVRKMDEDGEVVNESGFFDDSATTLRGWAIFGILVVLSLFGVWQIIELLLSGM